MSVVTLSLPPERRAVAVQRHIDAAAQDIAAGIAQERERVLELLRIAHQAVRIGVEIEVTDAIVAGLSPDEVRTILLNIAANEGSPT